MVLRPWDFKHGATTVLGAFEWDAELGTRPGVGPCGVGGEDKLLQRVASLGRKRRSHSGKVAQW